MAGLLEQWAQRVGRMLDHLKGNLLVRLGDSAGANKLSVRNAQDAEVAWIDSSGAISGSQINSTSTVTGRMVLTMYGNTRTDTPDTGEAWIQRAGGEIMWPGMPWMPLGERYYAVEIETADGVKTIPLEPYSATTVMGSHTVTAYERVVVVNSGSAATVTLPTATGSGQVVAISSVGAGAVTVDANGSETINGALTQTLYQYEAITVCDYASGAWTVL